ALRLKFNLAAAFYSVVYQVGAVAGDTWEAADTRRTLAAVREGIAMGPAATMKRIKLAEECMRNWKKAQAANDYALVGASFQSMVESVRAGTKQMANITGAATPYDALLEIRTPGLTSAMCDKWVAKLEPLCMQALRHRAAAPVYPANM